jgi:hypothetical protein
MNKTTALTSKWVNEHMTKGEWAVQFRGTLTPYIRRLSDYNGYGDIDICTMNPNTPKMTEANAEAIMVAVNNTWNAGINPEQVEPILKALEIVYIQLETYGRVLSDTATHLIIKEALDGARFETNKQG